jgi:PAS domain S-box-containing protein
MPDQAPSAVDPVLAPTAAAAGRPGERASVLDWMDEGYCLIEVLRDAGDCAIDYRFLETNASFTRQSGLDEAQGRRILELVPDIGPEWPALYGEVARSGQPVRRRYAGTALHGRQLDIHAFPITGSTTRVGILFTDVSERNAAAAALVASEASFRDTFDTAAIGIAHVALDGRWLRVNPALCSITGCTAEDLLQMDGQAAEHPDDVAANLYRVARLAPGAAAVGGPDRRYQRRDGTTAWLNLTITLARDAAGGPLHIIATVEDVTGRREAQDEMQRQQRFVQRLTQVMPNLLHLYDFADGRNVWVNRDLGLMIGYTAEECAAMGPLLLQRTLHPDDREPMRLHLAKVAASADHEALEFEYRLQRRDGEWRWFRNCDTVFSRDEAGQALELVGTATDITERRLIAIELGRALGAAEAANRAKSDFLSGMSHELRSPLNAILGFAQLIESGTPRPTLPQKDSVEQILKAGWYLLELINEILDLSMIESGRLSLSTEPVSLAEVFADCRAMVDPQTHQGAIRMTFPVLDTPCFVVADRTRLKQVFINLLSNAIKYNRQGGQVDVTCVATAAGRLRIMFEDTGCGLTPEQVGRLFMPFERLGQELGPEQGTGIGLVVSKRLVELMDGSIGVSSVAGAGSVFWIELRVGDAPAFRGTVGDAHEPVALPSPPGLQRRTVLCIEDNPANLLLLQRILAKRKDLHVLCARDGTRGVAIARSARPDVVLMDINLPGLSGYEALALLKQDPLTAGIPVIALSANAMAHDLARGTAAGFHSYLTKPIILDTFMAALDAALQDESPPSCRDSGTGTP